MKSCAVLFSVAVILAGLLPNVSAKPQTVTCGSSVKLMNGQHKVRLHSHDVKYGSGSGQQSVTGTVVKEDVNSHWTIKGPGDRDHCIRGEPVECGQKVRLEHLTTHRNLHSHHFSSPLSSQQEISAFGEGGRGDTGDVWLVMCEGDYWTRGDNMRLKHVDTGMYLSASGHTFGRPIQGQVNTSLSLFLNLLINQSICQMEIVGQQRPDGSTYWKTQEGVYIHQTDFDPKRQNAHDEL